MHLCLNHAWQNHTQYHGKCLNALNISDLIFKDFNNCSHLSYDISFGSTDAYYMLTCRSLLICSKIHRTVQVLHCINIASRLHSRRVNVFIVGYMTFWQVFTVKYIFHHHMSRMLHNCHLIVCCWITVQNVHVQIVMC